MPMNLHTVSAFYERVMTPWDASRFIQERSLCNIPQRSEPRNYEEAMIHAVGPELYDAFFRHYTRKQWGVDPKELPVANARRLPIRYTFNTNYFPDTHWVAIPKGGYSAMFERMVTHPNIRIELEKYVTEDSIPWQQVDHVIWTGGIDAFYGCRLGALRYRHMRFDHHVSLEQSFPQQGCAVINNCLPDVPWTRRTEHAWFSPEEHLRGTVITYEYPEACSPLQTPHYPMRLAQDLELYERYTEFERSRVTFCGRLGEYRYLDMDEAIQSGLRAANALLPF
jgi:UDP-galactopyranose mutase